MALLEWWRTCVFGVLIGDMVRRELGLNRYIPTKQEVERVKEEFGLYRVGLQYKPPPEEIETIIRAPAVMVNGEETERIECSGYKEVRNIVNSNGTYRTRIRGGVMLVIGEGLCLKVLESAETYRKDESTRMGIYTSIRK